jgi:hypothetical protein
MLAGGSFALLTLKAMAFIELPHCPYAVEVLEQLSCRPATASVRWWRRWLGI